MQSFRNCECLTAQVIEVKKMLSSLMQKVKGIN
jgi:hypothetical protein